MSGTDYADSKEPEDNLASKEKGRITCAIWVSLLFTRSNVVNFDMCKMGLSPFNPARPF